MQTTKSDHVGRERGGIQGFTLIELAIVLAILGLIVGLGLQAGSGMLESRKRAATADKLEAVEQAIILFAARHRRLPCPARVEDGNGLEYRDADTGECRSSTADWDQKTGVVPWVSLGLRQVDALDAWNNYVTYRVADDATDGLTLDDEMDMSTCAPSAAPQCDGSNDCDSTYTDLDSTLTCGYSVSPANYVHGRGLFVNDGATFASANRLNDPLPEKSWPATSSGAAFLLISHGQNHSGAFALGTAGTDPTPNPSLGTVGADEATNKNGIGVSAYMGADATAGYVDRLESTDTDDYFDDIIRRPTVLWVANRARLGPQE